MSGEAQTVGVVGAGQLARMLALAGVPLGLRFVFLDPAQGACAAGLGEHLCGAYDDRALLERLAARADVVTYEFENVPAESAAFLAARVPVFPSPEALAISRDRWREKTLFGELGIPSAPCAPVESRVELEREAARLGFPCLLKTRTLGYDGKGQALIQRAADCGPAWELLGDRALVLEGFVRFEREVSILGARGRDGETAFYPLVRNMHRGGILRLSVPALSDPAQARAQALLTALFERLDYVGVLALELFEVGGTLLANEMAPRVHNSGHWTIEGAQTSQFENHLRAVLGLSLGQTTALGASAMVNCIGTLPARGALLAIPGAHLHDYGKEPRPGRKLGHVTLRASEPGAIRAGLRELEELGLDIGEGAAPVLGALREL